MNDKNMKIFATRLDNDSLNYIGVVSKESKIDKSESFRMLLKKGIELDRKQRALQLYMQGKLSLEGAVKFADMYMGEFLEFMEQEGVESNLTLEMVKKGMLNIKNKRI